MSPRTGDAGIAAHHPGDDADRDAAPRLRRRGGITAEDFYAYLPAHDYIFVPSREHWPADSVNACLPPMQALDEQGHPVYENGRPKFLRASAWLDTVRPVDQAAWAPGEPELIEGRLVCDGGRIERTGLRAFNYYRPPAVTPGDPDRARRWLDHVALLYPDDAGHIVRWLAHRVQRPGEKINHALVLGGAQGIGKDTILSGIADAVGPWNIAEVSPQQLVDQYNGFLKSVILRVSEASDLGEVDRFSFYEHLKTYTAAPPDMLRVNEKYLRNQAVLNVCGVVITTNHKTGGIHLPPDDRRHYVAWSNVRREDLPAGHCDALFAWYRAGGGAHVAAYLAGVDLSGFNPKAPPPRTEAFWAIVDAARVPEDAEMADALDALGRPPAVTIATVAGRATPGFREWLLDRRNSRRIPHRLEEGGYVACRNKAARDGLWVVCGRRCSIYVRKELGAGDGLAAAVALAGRSYGGGPDP